MASEELEAFCVQHKDPKWKKKEKFLVENNTSYHVHSKVEKCGSEIRLQILCSMILI